MFTIRPFEPTDAEYEAFAAVERAVWPEYPDTADEWKHRDATRDPKYLFQRFVVTLPRSGDDSDAPGTGPSAKEASYLVATGIYCEPWWSMKPGKYFVNLSVHPDYRRRGIGTTLYNHLMSLVAEHDPITIVSNTREDQADAIHFLTKRGFQQRMRFPISYLDVPNFDPAPFAGILARVKELGIEIVSLAELAAQDADWKRKIWELDWELMQDVPSPDPWTRTDLETWQKKVLDSPGFNSNALFIALDAGRWIGMSGLWMAPAAPEKLYTGLTGVTRSHRRKGIATAMKVRAIGFARQYGAKVIETDNEENNPMYVLNLKLGFEPQPAWLDFEKRIKETD